MRLLVLGMIWLGLCGLAVGQAKPAGVPRVDPDYNMTVLDWWPTHPLNPHSQAYQAHIESPAPIVGLSPGQSIQQAIDDLPQTGGTIHLAPGEYDGFRIVGRSNVHVICPDGQAVVRAPVRLAVCDEALDYGRYDLLVSRAHRDPDIWRQHRTPTHNYLFRNLIFDGEHRTPTIVHLARVYDVLFEQCVFRNTVNPRRGHPGQVTGHAGLNNIWFRACRFEGESLYAVYLDGAHGSGMIECTVKGDAFSSGAFLFLTNDDFTEDINENGRIDRPEERNAKYIVVVNNTFEGNTPTAVQVTGENVLVQHNRAPGTFNSFVGVDPRFSHQAPELQYRFTGIYVLDNVVGKCRRAFVLMSNGLPTPPDYTPPVMGEYHIRGNVVESADGLVREVGTIVGPNVAE